MVFTFNLDLLDVEKISACYGGQGKFLISARLLAGSHSLWLSPLSNGLYIARFSAEGESWVDRLVLQH